MVTPGGNSYIFMSGPLLGWAWDWDTRNLIDTRGTVQNPGGTLPGHVVTNLRQDPGSQMFFDQYYSRYQQMPYAGYNPPQPPAPPPVPPPQPPAPPPQPPQPPPLPTGQQPPVIAGLKNPTQKQKEFLAAHPQWATQNVVRVEAKKGSPYIQWLYNVNTGEFLTATRGALKLDALSQGTRERFGQLDSVKRYITPGQPPDRKSVV